MNLKKLLCLLLALAMVLSLAACSDSGSDKDEDEDEEIVEEEDEDEKDKDDEDKKDEDKDDEDKDDEDKKDEEEEASDSIVGIWKGYIYMTEDNTGLDGLVTHTGLPVVFTFDEDGTATMTVYEPEIEEAMAVLEEDLVNYMVDVMYAEAVYQDMTEAELEEFVQGQVGMSVEEYCRSYVEEMGLLDTFMEISDSTTYTVEGDVLNLNGEELTFSVEGNTLTIYDSTNPTYWEQLGFEFPVELERVG